MYNASELIARMLDRENTNSQEARFREKSGPYQPLVARAGKTKSGLVLQKNREENDSIVDVNKVVPVQSKSEKKPGNI